MKKTAETEYRIKRAIRDILVIDPLISVQKLQDRLLDRGFKTAAGNPLEWRYVAKLVRKTTQEQNVNVDRQKVQERLADIKEQYRLLIEEAMRIAFYRPAQPGQTDPGIPMPTNKERLQAINTILKMNLAIFNAEMDAGIFERKLGTMDLNLMRSRPLNPEAERKIVEAFQRWGILPNEPQQVEVLSAPQNNGATSTTS